MAVLSIVVTLGMTAVRPQYDLVRARLGGHHPDGALRADEQVVDPVRAPCSDERHDTRGSCQIRDVVRRWDS